MNIECNICKKEYNAKGLSMHLIKKHNISFLEYVTNNLDQFSNYKACPVCGNITAGKSCSKKCDSVLRKEYSIKNIWARMNEETKNKAKQKISEHAKINGKGVNIWARMNESTKEAAKKKISNSMKMRVSGKDNPMYGKSHSSESIHKIFKHKKMNSFEKIVSKYLDDNNIEYYFQFFINNKSKYSYDFKLKHTNIIIECDGDYWHGGPGCKKYFFNVDKIKENDDLKTAAAENNGFRIFRFWESELKENITKLDVIIDLVKNNKSKICI